jgi:NTP pyrophosphatase (non-canonical NTP hydrolase)
LFFERNRFTLNWNEYQQGALTTAIYPLKRELEYTVLGLCSEVGEVGEAYAAGKAGWGYTADQLKAVKKEIGDCFWYTAAVADALDLPLERVALYGYTLGLAPIVVPNSRGLAILQLVRESSVMAGLLKKAIRDNEGFLAPESRVRLVESLYRTLWTLDGICAHFSTNRHAVMVENLNKLADRKSRGVLQGSGDNR